MKTRYRHVMPRAKGDRQPSQVIGLALKTHLEPVGTSGKLERMVMEQWHVNVLGKVADGRRHERDATGNSVSEFWRLLHAVATVGGTTLVASLGTLDAWAMLEFWEGLERGNIRLQQGDRQCDSESAQELSAMSAANIGASAVEGRGEGRAVPHLSRGILVTEDPPTIAYLWLRQCPALIRWVDIRNYGITAGVLPSNPRELSRELARTARGMIESLTSRGLGAVKDTAGSQAMFSFQRKHLSNAIFCHTVKSVLQLEADAYYSGRCECHRIGHVEGPIYELDVRGSYTYTMLHCPVPVRLVNYRLSTATGEVPDLGSERGFIAHVALQTAQPDYPYRNDAGTVWPIGVLETTLCGPELYDAMEHGRIRKWLAWAEYDMEPALSGFAREVYDLRLVAEESKDRPLAAWAKALAVSLVGKLGQRSKYWEWVPGIKPQWWYDQYYQRDKDGVTRRYQEIAGRYRREVSGDWGSDSVPAIAGWVTSAARMRLLGAIRSARLGSVVYLDTDSLFTTEGGYSRLHAAGWVRERELGFFQLKGVHPWMEIRNIKSYRTPSVDRSAGTPGSGAGAVLSVEGLRQSVYLSTYLCRASRPSSLRTLTSKVRHDPYRHGTILAGGKVAPLRVWDW